MNSGEAQSQTQSDGGRGVSFQFIIDNDGGFLLHPEASLRF